MKKAASRRTCHDGQVPPLLGLVAMDKGGMKC